jgi:hypothetical protein
MCQPRDGEWLCFDHLDALLNVAMSWMATSEGAGGQGIPH